LKRQLGWVLGPLELALTMIVIWRRQFISDARQAFDAEIMDAVSAKPKRRAATPSPTKRR
jgi:uncharacterized membrane protein